MTDISSAISAVAPRADAVLWTTALSPFMTAGGITTPRRVAAFIGQMAWESSLFTQVEENLNYSAARMAVVWPSRFTGNVGLAEACEHNPQALANTVYCDRMGNGNAASGDGWRYRGSGLVQLTGKEMHAKFALAAKMSVDDAANYMRTPKGAAQSACWFWQLKNLNRLADLWLLMQITQLINGGTNGLSQRIALCNAALKACGGSVANMDASPTVDELMEKFNPGVT